MRNTNGVWATVCGCPYPWTAGAIICRCSVHLRRVAAYAANAACRGGWSGVTEPSAAFPGRRVLRPGKGAEEPKRELHGVGRKPEQGGRGRWATQAPIQVK